MTIFSKRAELVDEIGVCVACKHFWPVYSGAGLRFQRYSAGLCERGIRMRVFTQGLTNEERRQSGVKKGESLPKVTDGVVVHRAELPGGWRRGPTFFSRLAGYCREHRNDIEIVHFLNLHHVATPWMRRLRRLGIATVFTCSMLGDLSPHGWKRMLQRFDRRLPLNQVDQVVAGSSVMRRYLEELGVSTPIRVIPNGVDLQKFRPIDSTAHKRRLRRELGLGQDWQVILAVGSITPRKGIDILVAAFARLSRRYQNAHLVLVGPLLGARGTATSAFHQRLRRTIETAGLEDRVIFTGIVNNVEDYMRAADLFVLASRREGMPNAPLESMACGVPVIMTPFVGLPTEFGLAGVHYALSVFETEGLASDIEGLLKSAPDRQGLGRRARQWVERKLDLKCSVHEYAALYRELAERSHGPNFKSNRTLSDAS